MSQLFKFNDKDKERLTSNKSTKFQEAEGIEPVAAGWKV